MNPSLIFTPYHLNSSLKLKNHLVMAPMTRCMAEPDGSATPLMAEYYARRADAGLIITEGTIISPEGTGYFNVPGIYTQKHIDAWKNVTEAVHGNDGLIFTQIWHVGRVSHPSFLNGNLPISASATTMTNRIPRTSGLNYGLSRAASVTEIKEIIGTYAKSAENAIKAGFDGIEIHGANGYLIDQFLHYRTNFRDDEYGQTIENRARFAIEVVKACGEAIGYDRVGLRLSPVGYLNEITADKRDAAVFKSLLSQLNKLALAYVHTGNFDDAIIYPELDEQTMTAFLRKNYQGNLIACGSYTFNTAEAMIARNHVDLVAIGRPFIANPDLISRLKNNQALKAYDAAMLNELY